MQSHPLKKGSQRDHWRLQGVSELQVLESGLLALQSQLVARPPRSPLRQGSAVLRASFFERLLEGHVELRLGRVAWGSCL